MQYGYDPRLIVGDDIAESEHFLTVLLACQEFMVKEQERLSRKR